MNSISVLYLRTNSHSDEKIAVGLFAYGEKRYFSYSLKKIKKANDVIDVDIRSVIEKGLKKIESDINDYNKNSIKFSDMGLNESALKYLNTYSKGILEFEEPKPIALEINDKNYKRLFKLLVDSKENRKEKTASFKHKFNKKLEHEAFNKIDKNYKISPDYLNTYYSHKVDFIGKNGSFLVGNGIDFDKLNLETIDKNIISFNRIIHSLENISKSQNLPKGSYNLFTVKPKDKERKIFFEKVHNDKKKLFNLSMLDEIDMITQNLEKNNYIKFSDYISGIKI